MKHRRQRGAIGGILRPFSVLYRCAVDSTQYTRFFVCKTILFYFLSLSYVIRSSTLQDHCKRTRPLSRHQHQLFWDLLLVLRGGRTAMMLDYAPGAPAAALVRLLRDVHMATGVSCESQG